MAARADAVDLAGAAVLVVGVVGERHLEKVAARAIGRRDAGMLGVDAAATVAALAADADLDEVLGVEREARGLHHRRCVGGRDRLTEMTELVRKRP